MTQFVYIPASDDKPALWLNLSTIAMVVDEGQSLIVFAYGDQDDPIAYLSGTQSNLLRAALSPSPKLPELPKLDAAQRLEARIERRGRLNHGISDAEYFDRFTEGKA